MALPPDILRTIKDNSRRLLNLETTPQPPNINLSEQVSAGFDASDGALIEIIITLSNDNNARLLGMFNWSIYRNSVSADNLWPYGANWTANPLESARFFITSWTDWGTTDNNNIVAKLFIWNDSGSNLTNLLLRANFRYLEREASAA